MRKQLYTLAANSLSRMFETPPYIILFVSNTCPNACRHCWYSRDWKKENLREPVLTNDELENISKSIKSVRFLSLTGGEAFLRDGIEEVLRAFAVNSGVSRFDIPTSGFDPDLIATKVEAILARLDGKPFRVDVSLDGTEEVHNSIRQNNSAFQNAVSTLEALKRIRSRHKNFDVSIITTVSDYNSHEIGRLAEFVEHALPDGEWMVNIARGATTEVCVSEEAFRAYREANDIISRRIRNNNFSGDKAHSLGKWLTAKNSLRRDMIYKIIGSELKGGGCAAGSLAGVIFNDGDVRPCETLPLSFGNIRDYAYDLGKAWNSDKAKQGREEIQKSKCICTHECFLSVSILMQPSCWFRLASKRLAL